MFLLESSTDIIHQIWQHQDCIYIINCNSELKDIVGWDRPPQTRPVPAVRPPHPDRPRIYSRRIRRCRLPGIVRTECFSPSGGSSSINHAGTGGNRTDVRLHGDVTQSPLSSTPKAKGTSGRWWVHVSAGRCGCYLFNSASISTHSCRADKIREKSGNGITRGGCGAMWRFRFLRSHNLRIDWKIGFWQFW